MNYSHMHQLTQREEIEARETHVQMYLLTKVYLNTNRLQCAVLCRVAAAATLMFRHHIGGQLVNELALFFMNKSKL